MKYPYVVIYRGPDGKEAQEGFKTSDEVSAFLNELWGECGPRGPERHSEARAVLAAYANRARTR